MIHAPLWVLLPMLIAAVVAATAYALALMLRPYIVGQGETLEELRAQLVEKDHLIETLRNQVIMLKKPLPPINEASLQKLPVGKAYEGWKIE